MGVLKFAAVAAAAVLGAGVAAGPASAAPPVPDEVESAWVAHRLITLYVDTPDGPDAGPSDARPDADVFLTAPQDPANPLDPGVVIPSPPAPQPIIVPVHDTVLDGPHGPADCFGVQVLPAAGARPGTVLTRPDPNGGATLAYAVVVGGHRVALTSGPVIRLAAKVGLVTLDRSWPGYGGTCWTGARR
ncbi:hypothetical protein [Actinomadura parmotrematis]|uniref:Uncharacterized protein n=1 Tax=Actinomadura parmotrematis TaxID=2864039 RepID=A0ABS7FZK7_9ACTN|nr:hypothetical protein [Actinomadura parmotrematis]MBW8485882.1 hypothetical protein [Actinomadura parmotrematis]